jgi:nicotinamidase-related amidase
MENLGIIDRGKTVFVLVDIQEKFIPVMHEAEELITNTNILVKSSEILDIPLIVTEQYSKGLGNTTDRISLPEKRHLIEKVRFSCFGSVGFVGRLKELDASSLVLFGVEAHVCILKTALEALKNGYEVHVVADAISSRSAENRSIAIERMRQSGIFITSTEMILFQLLEKAGSDEFKAISRLIR